MSCLGFPFLELGCDTTSIRNNHVWSAGTATMWLAIHRHEHLSTVLVLEDSREDARVIY